MTDENIKKILRAQAEISKPKPALLWRVLEDLPRIEFEKIVSVPSPYKSFNFKRTVIWRMSGVLAACAVFVAVLIGGFYGVPGITKNSLVAEAESFAESAGAPEILLLQAEDAVKAEKSTDIFNAYEMELFEI